MRSRFGAASSSSSSVKGSSLGQVHSRAPEFTGRESFSKNKGRRTEGRWPGTAAVRHETRSPSGPPVPPRGTPTRTLAAVHGGPLKTRRAACLLLPALALAPSAPDLTSNTQEGNFWNPRESRTCPQKAPTSSTLNSAATGETFHGIEQERRVWSADRPPGPARSWRGAAASPSRPLCSSALRPPGPPLHLLTAPPLPVVRRAASQTLTFLAATRVRRLPPLRGIFGVSTFLAGKHQSFLSRSAYARSAASAEQHACVVVGDTPRRPAGRMRPQRLLPDGPSARTAAWPGHLETDRRRFSWKAKRKPPLAAPWGGGRGLRRGTRARAPGVNRTHREGLVPTAATGR